MEEAERLEAAGTFGPQVHILWQIHEPFIQEVPSDKYMENEFPHYEMSSIPNLFLLCLGSQ
jgi:hypothetical protein